MNASAAPPWLDRVRWDERGLVPCVVQERTTGEVLMLAWMNQESLRRTIESGSTWFWSRSRSELWNKGGTSGATQVVRSLHIDCDGDTLLCVVDQAGTGACHRNTATCFDPDPAETTAAAPDSAPPRPILAELLGLIAERDRTRPEGSYTAKLLAGGVDRAGKKVGEEATEVVIAAKNAATGQGTAELANESADLLFHLLVLWRAAGIDAREVVDALERRRPR